MAKLTTLKPRVQNLQSKKVKNLTVSSYRLTGSKLQQRRFNMWKESPKCNHCKRFVSYPGGFELDHVIPLHKGGEDINSNCQLLCIDCHANKTKEDLKV